MKREKFEEFLTKVRTSNESFMLTDGTQFNAYVQLSVNDKAKFIFSDYRFHHCNASDIMDMKLKPVALVCEKQVYLIDDYHFRSLHSRTVDVMNNEYKWENEFKNVVVFNDLLEGTKELLLNHLIPELYEALPKVELNEDRIKSAKQEARRRLLHKQLFVKEKPLADMKGLLTEEAFIRVLCGELNLEEHVTEQYLKSEETRANIKAYDAEVQKYVDSPICATWELELANALHNAKAKNVNMTFSFEGKSASGKIDVDKFLREFMNGHDIDKWCFSTTTGGEDVLKRQLGADWKRCLYPYHIDEVTYGGKTIYTAPEEAKSLRGDYVEKEEDYER